MLAAAPLATLDSKPLPPAPSWILRPACFLANVASLWEVWGLQTIDEASRGFGRKERVRVRVDMATPLRIATLVEMT